MGPQTANCKWISRVKETGKAEGIVARNDGKKAPSPPLLLHHSVSLLGKKSKQDILHSELRDP
jgi:hypothetical protein